MPAWIEIERLIRLLAVVGAANCLVNLGFLALVALAVDRKRRRPEMQTTPPSDREELLFEQALALPEGKRARFLDEACGGDLPLRRELEVLLAHHDEASSFFEELAQTFFPSEPAPHSDPSAEHDPLIGARVGHYLVLERIGSGGMGVVYRAEDVRLHRTVALKFLPEPLSRDEQAKRRFLREARTASTLDHPNICTIHEINERRDGRLYIAMSYYDGETLRDKLNRGGLPLEEALGYAAQIVRGLRAAHRKGIVHRDIKPANVMVTRQGTVKILDFGLAKLPDLNLTQTGGTLGTVAYMSPEQARGGRVDLRSDLWSFGVLLYELLTGERPFSGDYGQVVIYSILNETPRPASEVDPRVTPALDAVLERCLRKDPDERFASVEELEESLTGIPGGATAESDTGTGPTTAPTDPLPAARTARWRLLRSAWAGAGAVVFASLFLALAIPAGRDALLEVFGGASTGTGEALVAVVPFSNGLGDTPEDQALVDGLARVTASAVVRLDGGRQAVAVVPIEELYQRGVRSAGEARRLFGVDRAVTGSVHRIGSSVEVILNLEDTGRLRVLRSEVLSAPLSGYQEAVSAALAALLDLDGATPGMDPANPPSGEAYASYLRGAGYVQRYDLAGNVDRAISEFEQALELEPAFARAHVGLCEAAFEKYRKTYDLYWADRATASCARAVELDDSQAAARIMRGRIYLETGRYREAETEIRKGLALEPDNPQGHRWLGRVYEKSGAIAPAIESYRKAIALQPDLWIHHDELGILFSTQGRFEEAAELFERVIDLAPDNYLGYNDLAVVRWNQNRLPEARRLLERSIGLQPNAVAYRNLGNLNYLDGRYAEAVRLLESARELRDREIWNWLALADAYYWNDGNGERAAPAWRRIADLAGERLVLNPREEDALIGLAHARIALGQHEDGRVHLERLAALPVSDSYTPFYIGRMYAMLGDARTALSYIGIALERGFDLHTPDNDPWLDELRRTPGYQTLRRRHLEARDLPSS